MPVAPLKTAAGDDFDLGDSLSGASFSLGFRFGPS